MIVEYVLYHELLHKALGVRAQSGRRQVHNRAFRDAEGRFVQRAEAEAALKRLGNNSGGVDLACGAGSRHAAPLLVLRGQALA